MARFTAQATFIKELQNSAVPFHNVTESLLPSLWKGLPLEYRTLASLLAHVIQESHICYAPLRSTCWQEHGTHRFLIMQRAPCQCAGDCSPEAEENYEARRALKRGITQQVEAAPPHKTKGLPQLWSGPIYSVSLTPMISNLTRLAWHLAHIDRTKLQYN